MRVIGAGFGRTGTLSLKAALETLGYGPCYHMTEVFDKPSHVAFWDEAADRKARGGRVEDFEEVFSGYEATVDWPGCFFWRELMRRYPDAKVLLTVRDPEGWYDSAEATIARGTGGSAPDPESYLGRLAARIAGLFAPAFGRAPSMVRKVIVDGTFGGRFGEREHAVRVFREHVAEVERSVPREKLLVYEVKEGWGPLCSFLGAEVPDEPFPRLNERGQFPKVMARGALRAAFPRAAAAGAALATASVLLLALRHLRR